MIRTGSIGIDIALGGGWCPGIHEIWGDPGSGKTVLALHTVESVTRARQDTLWIDTVDGVAHMDTAPRVIVARMRAAERIFYVAEQACQEPAIALVVVDSANFMARRRELDGDPAFVPHPQREYKDELTSLKRLALATGTTVLFVSQPRDKERTPIRGTGISEKALWRVHLHADVVHQDASREIQATVRNVPGKITKHDAARFMINPGKGIDQALELVHMGVSFGCIDRRGTWLEYRGGPFLVHCQGADEMARLLSTRRNSTPLHDLDAEIRKVAGIG